MARVRDAAPPPHDAVQVPQLLHTVIAQSTGHAASPQPESSSNVAVQLRPAPCGATETSLALEEVPGPLQLTEHADQLVQSSKAQSTGHTCANGTSRCDVAGSSGSEGIRNRYLRVALDRLFGRGAGIAISLRCDQNSPRSRSRPAIA
jgi:hypothetical protein